MAAELLLPTARASDTNNDPYAGAVWYFYATGTSTPQAVFADADLTTSLGSTVTADSAGKFVPIYFNAALAYRGVLKNASGSVTLHDIDPINSDALTQVTRKFAELFTATDWSGITADGTDQTAALIAAITANVGAQERKLVIIPPGMVWHPQEVLQNATVLTKERLNFLDLSGMTGKRGVNENTKIFGIYGVDPGADEDTYWTAGSGHHPVFMLNNLGTANTGSAEQALMSMLYARGFFTDGVEDERQFVGAMIAQFRRSVLDATIWEHVWRSLAPWAALADGVILRRWAAGMTVAVGDVVLTNTSKWFRYTVGGVTGTVVPNHTSGTAADGTATLEYLDSEDRLIFGFDYHGRVKSNGAGNSADLVAWKQSSIDTTATAVERISGTGASKAVRFIMEPTDGAGTVVPTPAIGATTAGAMEIRAAGGSGSLIATIENNGDILLYLGRLGYGPGSGNGGAVTQATSRTTGVTLNKATGAITLVSAAGSASWQTFTVTNSKVSATDNVIAHQKSGADKHMVHVTAVADGSFDITFATTGGTTVEQPVFNFSVIRGAVT